ncbi:hypothetical protein HPT27_13845 [Permianibacter sp. IMCC34836]|uniref:hypothetical protein n=1 Tax=Permianibacter fluminis TaxID=2738515 RepID=UPI00155652A0|nr:hypothetical protein [Permianibacter fluminis]NQD38111.1 hypothetical protein [Permianibacter fluminis]
MNRQEQDEALIQRSREALNHSAEQLDYAAQLKLQRARAAALAALSPQPAKAPWWQQKMLWLAAMPAALAIVLALPLLLRAPAATDAEGLAQTDSETAIGFDDMELLAADADLDTLNDIEFYQWLAEHPDGSDA